MGLAAANPVLAVGRRNGVVETLHRGVVCVVDRRGSVVFSRGDVNQVAYPRSALKFLQALPLLASGAFEKLGLTDADVAVMCASHNAEPRHLEAVRSLLSKAGVPEAALGCGSHPLGEASTAEALIRAGLTPTDLHNNCSGKHAGFLAFARHLGVPLEGYLALDHPVQIRVRATIARMAEAREDEMHAGVDGCSAPNYAMPVVRMAVAIKNLVQPHGEDPALDAACRRIVRAVTSHPFLVGGSGRYCTDLMEATAGRVIGKVGAEGFYVAGLVQEGMGIAIKTDDGVTGPPYSVLQALLDRSGALSAEASARLAEYRRAPVRNWRGVLVGHREPAEGLTDGWPDRV